MFSDIEVFGVMKHVAYVTFQFKNVSGPMRILIPFFSDSHILTLIASLILMYSNHENGCFTGSNSR